MEVPTKNSRQNRKPGNDFAKKLNLKSRIADKANPGMQSALLRSVRKTTFEVAILSAFFMPTTTQDQKCYTRVIARLDLTVH